MIVKVLEHMHKLSKFRQTLASRTLQKSYFYDLIIERLDFAWRQKHGSFFCKAPLLLQNETFVAGAAFTHIE